MNNSVFWKTNMHRYQVSSINFDARRNYLVLEPNDYTTKCFSEKFLGIKMRMKKSKIKKPIHQGLPILDINKIRMCDFWYDYIELKNKRESLSHMDTNSFITNIKTDDIYVEFAKDIEERFDTSNYGLDRPLPIGKNK